MNGMFGKLFSSTYTGSMRGKGGVVFSVWGYVIANTVRAQVELVPDYVAALVGESEEDVVRAIDYLCSPDPRSRNPMEGGRRLIKEGTYAYRVVTHPYYNRIQNADELREYNRQKKAESRARKRGVKPCQTVSNRMSRKSRQAEAEADLEPPLGPPQPKENPRATKKGATAPKGPAAPKASATRGRSPKTVDAWAGPSREHSAYASRHGLDLDTEVAAFRDHHLAEGTVLPKGWPAAFSKWLLDRTPPAEPKPEPEPKPKRPRRSVSPPAGWAPSDEHRQIAREGGVDFEREFQKCLDHQLARNEGFVGQRGWDAGVRNWMRRAPEFNRSRYSKPSEPSTTESRVLPAEEAARLRAAAAQPSIRKAKQASQESA